MNSLTPSRLLKIFPALALIALALPASALGQASRTWVSGVGDDANPCSRTAPCKTFAGAISKTAAAGEINCLDPGGFGGVTITKAMTIMCQYTEGGVLVSGTNAIVINAAATDRVTLRGLDINGLNTGLNGVRVLQARAVRILDSEIYEFVRDGVDFEPSNNVAKLVIDRTHIHDNTGAGVMVAPTASGVARATLRGNQIDENGCAVASSSRLTDPAFNFAVDCGTGTGAGGPVAVNVFQNGMSDHATSAVLSNGAASTVRISQNLITGALGPALVALNSGQLNTFGDNRVTGNPGGNGATTGATLTFSKRRAKSKGH
jgi:hypothetical protein